VPLSVITFGQSYERASAKLSATGDWVYTRHYRLEAEAWVNDEAEVAAYCNAAIPAQHPGNPQAWLDSLDVDLLSDDGAQKYWGATATWKMTNPPDLNHRNPLARPAKISRQTVPRERPLFLDLDGEKLASTAGEFFEPPFAVEDQGGVYVIERNFDRLPGPADDEFVGSTNNAALTLGGVTYPAGHLVCTKIDSSPEQTENGVTFWTWQTHLASSATRQDQVDFYNVGTYVLDRDQQPVRVNDGHTTIDRPVPINEAGTAWTEDDGTPLAELVTLPRRVREQRDFSGFVA